MISIILVVVVAAIHGYIAFLEMVQWDTPRSHRVFGMTPELAGQTTVLAFNQGLYNLFLAAGLLTGLILKSQTLVYFILACVVVAGVVGLLSGIRSAFIFQTIPAALAIAAYWMR